MARYIERSRKYIDEVVARWREECLVEDGSLLFDEHLWTEANIDRVYKNVVEAPLLDERSFIDKYKLQLENDRALILLGAEALAVYYLFVWPGAVGTSTKRSRVSEVIGWASEQLDENSDVYKAFAEGVGHPGQYFLYRPDAQVGFLLDFARKIKQLPVDERPAVLDDPWRLRDLIDRDIDGTPSMRHILLHLLAPDEFERIASDGHKRSIAATFDGLLPEDAPEDMDERLLLIRSRLGELLDGRTPASELDYYRPPLQGVWGADAHGGEGVPELEALEIKKQIVLYGPPGTSKTYQAKDLADRLIRNHALRHWKPAAYFQRLDELPEFIEQRVRRLQLHPAYSYEEFIRGLRLRDGETKYEPGFLPRLVDEIEKEPADAPGADLPWVLILDELNRADLSRVFGEAFSVLEDRDAPVQLIGTEPDEPAASIHLPENLYVIGTMNLIDQSLEQVDFALRRRFLWVRRGFERQLVVDVIRERWATQPLAAKYGWDLISDHINKLADNAKRLNEEISESSVLGGDYEIGHTYFFEITEFMTRAPHLATQKNRTSAILWTKNGEARSPLVDLWRLSIGPLLEQYLQGVQEPTRTTELNELRRVLESGSRT